MFLFMMDFFSGMLKRVEGASLIRGFEANGRQGDRVCVSHLLSNYTILCCEADVEWILHIRMLLLCFQVVIGSKVNVRKSEMIPIGAVDNVHALVEIFFGEGRCRVGTLPKSYLGLPVGGPHKSTSIWNPILEKIEMKLAGW